MAVEDSLSDLVSPSVGQDLAKLRSDVKETLDVIIDASKKTKGAFDGITMSKDIAEMVGFMKQSSEAAKESSDAIKNLTASYKAQIEAARLATQQEKAFVEVAKQDTEAQKQKTEATKQATEATKQAATAKVAESQATLNSAKANTEASKQEEIHTRVTIALTKEKERLQALLDKEAAALAKQQGAYYQLNQTYNKAAKESQNLGAELVMLQAEFNRLKPTLTSDEVEKYDTRIRALSAAYQNSATDANKMHQQLLAIDTSIGKSQRNVGNYNGAVMALGNILRDTPAFAYSTATGLLAISNNIPIFVDELGRLKEANAALKASGQETIPVWKTLAGSFTSVSGIITLAVAAVTIITARMAMHKDATDKTTESLKKYNETIQHISENSYADASKEAARLRLLADEASNLGKSMDVRTAAVQQLQKLYPAYFNDLNREATLNGNVKKAVDDATESIYKKAAASAALSKFEETNKTDYELLQQERQLTAERAKQYDYAVKTNAESIISDYNRGKSTTEDGGDPLNELRKTDKALAEVRTRRAELRKQMDQYLADAKAGDAGLTDAYKPKPGSIESLQKQISELSDKRNKTVDATTESGKKEISIINAQIEAIQRLIDLLEGRERQKNRQSELAGIDALLAASKRYQEALAQAQKNEFEQSAAKNKAIYEDENRSLRDRLDAFDLYQKDKAILAQLDSAKELAQLDDREKALREKEAVYAKIRADHPLTDNQKKELAAIKKDEDTVAILRKQLNDKLQADLANIEANGIITRQQIIKAGQRQFLTAEEKGLQDRLADFDDSYNQEAKVLADSYLNKQISEEKFQLELKKLKNKYQGITLNEQIAEYEYELKSDQLNAEQKLEIQRKLNKAKLDLTNNAIEGAGLQKKNNPFGLDNDTYNNAVKVADNVIGLYQQITKAIDARYQAEIAQIERRKQLLDDAATAEIEAINNSGYAAADKERKIAEVKAQTALKDKEFIREQNELKRKQAIADKAANIAQIIQKTALAVISALVIPPPFGQILASTALATGAFELATALQTQIPQYEEGTKGKPHPGGPARVGEKGKPEAIFEPGKAPYVVDSDRIIDLAAGSHVLPLTGRDVAADLAKMGMGQMPVAYMMDSDTSTMAQYLNGSMAQLGALRDDMKEYADAVLNKPVGGFMMKGGELWSYSKTKNGITHHIDKRFR